MKSKAWIIFAVIFVCSLSGCGKASILGQYDIGGIAYLSYTDIDTVCDTPELAEVGTNFLSQMEGHLLLSFVVDSSIELTEELGDYDHLILANPRWVEHFGSLDKLESVEYDSLSGSMREFLNIQLPVWTVTGEMLPDGVGLYQYKNGDLLAFPVNVTLGGAAPIKAQRPLIILVDRPAQTLSAKRCMLPLTSSGNVLFSDAGQLKTSLAEYQLTDYATVQVLNDLK